MKTNTARKSNRTVHRDLLVSRLALTVSETAQLLGVSASTVRGMIRKGKLPGKPIGEGTAATTYVVPCAGLELWLKLSGEQLGKRD